MKNTLTTHEEKLIPQIRDKWINAYHNNTSFDESGVRSGVNWLYTDICNYDSPIVVIVNSPYEAQLTANLLRAQVGDQVWDQVGAQVWDQVRDQVRAQVGDQVRAQVWDQVRDQVRAQVWDQVRAQVRDQVGAQVGAQVGDQVGAQVGDQVRAQVGAQLKYFGDCFYVSYRDSYWVSFYDYFTQIGVIDNSTFNRYRDLVLNGAYYSILFNGLAIISRPPKSVVLSNDTLHNVIGPSVDFGSYKTYHVNGRGVPSNLITEQFTFTDFNKETNEDIRAAMITIIKERDGQEALLNFLGASMVDEQTIVHDTGDLETVRLYKTDKRYSFLQDRHGNSNQPYCWSEMVCPSTGQTYLLDNSADFTNAIEAMKFLRPELVPTAMEYNWTQFAN